jgi:predicted dehydrogenase
MQNRRSILRSGASLLPTMFLAGELLATPPASPNQRFEVAVIGIGARGKYLIGNLPAQATVTALCDCSLEQVESARKPDPTLAGLLNRFVDQDAGSCRVYQDYRRMFEQQRFDAVIIAAPDHHHALAAILAMQAGAHVYVEKPLALTIKEGRAIATAAAKYNRIVQVGSQQRTMQVNRDACEFIRSGGLGKVSLVEERNFPSPMPYVAEQFPAEPIPSGMDWDLFCGPSPARPYNKMLWSKDAFKFGYLTWRGWDLFEDYSGHLMTNWGAHSIDMIQYALGKDATGPVRVERRPDEKNGLLDDQWHDKTPPLGTLADKQRDRDRFCPLVISYADGTEIHFKPGMTKTVFHGQQGKLLLSRNDYQTEPAGLLPEPAAAEQAKWAGEGHVARPHLDNWFAAIESGATLNAPVEVGHRSATVCHLANIARRSGRNLTWDPVAEKLIDAPSDLLDRPQRTGFELPY